MPDTPSITVRYKRLETVGNYCNVEIEAAATYPMPRTADWDAVFSEVQGAVDKQIADAKQRKREEIEREFRAREVLGEPDQPIGGDS